MGLRAEGTAAAAWSCCTEARRLPKRPCPSQQAAQQVQAAAHTYACKAAAPAPSHEANHQLSVQLSVDPSLLGLLLAGGWDFRSAVSWALQSAAVCSPSLEALVATLAPDTVIFLMDACPLAFTVAISASNRTLNKGTPQG